MQPLIDIKNCSVMRNEYLAIDRLNLGIAPGESIAIIGPNGAGKSSLLKLISREIYPLVRPDSYVRIMGNEHFDIRDYQSHIGMLSQDLQQSYNKNVPGLETVISGFFGSNSLWQHFEITPQQITKAKEIMTQIKVDHLQDRRYGELSTGQQRRLLLARALVHDPDTLILDEPTNGLDIQASTLYLNALRELIRNGRGIILVTHHISEIPPEINRVVLMNSGKIIADGNKEQVLSEQQLSGLFKTDLTLSRVNDYYHVSPK